MKTALNGETNVLILFVVFLCSNPCSLTPFNQEPRGTARGEKTSADQGQVKRDGNSQMKHNIPYYSRYLVSVVRFDEENATMEVPDSEMAVIDSLKRIGAQA